MRPSPESRTQSSHAPFAKTPYAKVALGRNALTRAPSSRVSTPSRPSPKHPPSERPLALSLERSVKRLADHKLALPAREFGERLQQRLLRAVKHTQGKQHLGSEVSAYHTRLL